MSDRANGEYRVRKWDESAVDEFADGTKITRASVAGAYTGELEATAHTESVMWYRADGTASYAGVERIEGTLAGRTGGFVLMSSGSYDGGIARSTVRVVPGSGTGELEGLSGEGTFEATHEPPGRLVLDYTVE